MYSWLLHSPLALAIESSPLTWFEELHVRVVLRPTALYAPIGDLLAGVPESRRAAVEDKVATVLGG
jgi:hypothetical protein